MEKVTQYIKTGNLLYCKNCGNTIASQQGYCLGCGSDALVTKEEFDSLSKTTSSASLIKLSKEEEISILKKEVEIAKLKKELNDIQNDNTTCSRTTYRLLAFFLGGLGIHEFYRGSTVSGILFLSCCWTGIPSLAAIVQIFTETKDGKGRLMS